MKPAVSILIPCYNAERWIAQAIESALSQSLENCEVIVYDDGSTDSSPAIIRSFGSAIRYERGSNRGGGAARNRLVEMGRADWLQFLDADDYLMPDKIENQYRMARHSGADLLFGPVLIDRGGELEPLPIPCPHDDPWILLARWFLPQTGSPLWRKQAIVDAGGWKLGQPCCQEHELYFRLLRDGARFEYLEDGGAVYRKWSDQTVCERDPVLVIGQRLQIENSIEHTLRSRGELTAARLRAINQARFESARSAWRYDRPLARSIIRSIRLSQRDFQPGGDAGPPSYALIYRLFGFAAAEKLAASIRRFRQRTELSPLSHSNA